MIWAGINQQLTYDMKFNGDKYTCNKNYHPDRI
ncbi:hypothetical protein FHW36_104250 [Chitinophaga polysaccharea]|uniref:Uncharacterized protein n=1 Tax=Chitinophaga polysaccharea TaxID=1293035 RepID=A0A561PR23_9BACT|nr:hypothetical protein FHW36_104250 [Chitinophaga polysaccharea]